MGRGGYGLEERRAGQAVVGQKSGLDGTKEQFLHPSPSLGLAFPGDSPQLPPSLQAPQPSMRRSVGVGSPATATASSWSHQASKNSEENTGVWNQNTLPSMGLLILYVHKPFSSPP